MPPDPARPHIAVCPGSYDPVTNGHIDVITRAAETFDEIIVAVVNASTRKDRALFSAEERVHFVERATSHLPNVRVDTFDVLVTEYARRVGAAAIVKGLRAISDFEYELEMNQLNRHLASDIESVYLMASPQYSFLSSSGVKEIATFGGNVSNLVPDEVARRLKEALAR
ncbi:MAG TPA: pantetheine-phosphate adenylyltransferase [Solirubrobacteraceae bacterium]|nr:pantetheine-phosphate adenylyltransferase [Solirubrobacteraceae bacterium]